MEKGVPTAGNPECNVDIHASGEALQTSDAVELWQTLPSRRPRFECRRTCKRGSPTH